MKVIYEVFSEVSVAGKNPLQCHRNYQNNDIGEVKKDSQPPEH